MGVKFPGICEIERRQRDNILVLNMGTTKPWENIQFNWKFNLTALRRECDDAEETMAGFYLGLRNRHAIRQKSPHAESLNPRTSL